MRINGIANNNANFKGAYVISGTNAEVNRAKKGLRKSNVRMHYEIIGNTPHSDTLPAYLLVTTGKDIKTYLDFAKTAERLYDENAKMFSDELTENHFETIKEYESHRYMSIAFNILEVLASKCNFSKPLHNISAKRVTEAIKNDKFDYEEGRIKK